MSSPSELLHQLLEDDFIYEVMDNPEFGSQAGEHDLMLKCPNKLQDVSPAAYERRAQHSLDMITKATELERLYHDKYDRFEQSLIRVFLKQHQDVYDALQYCKMYLMPINGIGSGCPTYSFVEMVEWMRFEIAEDYQLYLDRLKAFPTQMDQFISAFREGIHQNFIASLPMTRNVINHLQSHIDGNLDELYAPLKDTSASSSSLSILSTELRDEIIAAIEKTREGFIKFRDFFTTEYIPHVRPDAGCTTLPNGSTVYDTCLRYHTTTNKTADEIHEIGLAEVTRIQDRYRNDVLIPLGFDPDDLTSFMEHVKTERQFYVSTKADLLDVYNQTCRDIEKILPQYFNEFPKSQFEIKSRDGGPTAYYLAGTVDGKRPGRFYINTTHINQKAIFERVALSLHEAIPGHHHQLALILEDKRMPKFLRFLEDRRYEVCPCRRNMCTAHLEGWGLYSEYLGEEMGLYKTPYELFGRLSMEMMRAVRLVVDTGIHRKGWSIEKSVQYMMEMTGKHRPEVEGEVYRYASWPGQACAYKIGEIEIRRLRRYAEEKLGSKFDVKNFHSVCLINGPLSLSLLEPLVNEYISTTLLVK